RKIITDTFIEIRPEVEKMKAEAQVKALEIVKNAGKTEISKLSDEDRKKWQALMAPKAEAAFVERAGAEGKKALELYRAELKRLGA
ncbi:MAG: TRAP transporter substrate-binding protein, partial [Pseudorhodoplanes sp.]